MREARPTDIQACYVDTCANNNVLDCDLLLITIGVDGRCMNYTPIDTTVFPAVEEEPHH